MAEQGNGAHGFISRRGFVRLCAGGMLAPLLPACESEEERALGYRPALSHHTPFITPNEDFYLVAVDPKFRPAFGLEQVGQQWSLALAGIDGRVQQHSYAELEAMANRVIPYTFECIGNSIGGSLIGNAKWHVLPLKSLLQRAGLSGEVKSVMFEGLDDFYSSVSIERATDDYAFLALKMNGVPLPAGHGFPARVILPDLYGMKQPRWLRRITLQRNAATTSYWEKRGWAGEVPVKNFARIDPPNKIMTAKDFELGGVAFAGARGISRVEISFNEGKQWAACKLETPTQEHVWSLWSYHWPHPGSGKQQIMVRTTDGRGQIQTATRAKSYPDGASGYHKIQL